MSWGTIIYTWIYGYFVGLDEFKNKYSEWKHPNGDKLILGVIDQVCTFGRN